MALLQDKYFVRKTENEEWHDVTTLIDGCRILSIGGYDEKGKAVNVYAEQWIGEQAEDFMIATLDDDDNPIVIRENVDIEITFICGNKYATNAIDARTQHDAFVEYMMNSDVYVKSAYTGKEVRCVCLDGYKPTTENLHRGQASYVMGTIKLHTLDVPTVSQVIIVGSLYIGFGGDAITNEQEIASLTNVQHYNVADAHGSYTIVCPSTSYLWICTKGTISGVNANGFEVPMEGVANVGEYHCYRTSNSIKPHTMSFNITTS